MSSLLPHLPHLYLASSACGTNTGLAPSLYDGLKCDASGNITLTKVADAVVIIANIARILIWLAGALAVIFVIIGGVYYIVSAGDPGRIKKAKDILTNAAVGIVLTVSAYAVVTFIAKGF